MTTPAAGRRFSSSSLRHAAVIALGAGGVLGLAAALGPIWVVRVGIALVLVAGVVAVRFAWRETREQRQAHGRQLLSEARAHKDLLSQERERNAEVLDVLRRAGEESDEEIVQLQLRIGKLRTQLTSLRSDHATLQADLTERDQRIQDLVADLAARLEELHLLRAGAEDAEVLPMPRHAVKTADWGHPVKTADWDALPTAEELWAPGNYPTVVDLQKLAYPSAGDDEVRKHA